MKSIKRQAGVSLVEAMIGIALSMIVVASMVGLMSSSMGSATRIIEMSQLTDELRNAMSMMTRDVRRANYSANAAYCYANSDCGASGGIAEQSGDIAISGECFTFNLDRDWDGDASENGAGGFRRVVDGDGIGRIEMWVGGNSPSCVGTHNDWLPVTDDGFVNVTAFTVDDSASFSGTVVGEAGATVTQRTRRLDLLVAGELLIDNNISRTVADTIKVRNDFLN